MAQDAFELAVTLPAPPDRVYEAWLDPDEHAAFTGGVATIDAAAGGKFTAWDGYISGTTLELDPPRRIVQAWRTTDFTAADGDSRVTVTLEPDDAGGTRLTLAHGEIPEGQGERYAQGWREYYFESMQAYFGDTDAAADALNEAEEEDDNP
ncbi:MAG: hypothetical protein EXR79_13685 [Myxococcales bacterium]|nr:hypothetical protein [Myxococcales bacterium]